MRQPSLRQPRRAPQGDFNVVNLLNGINVPVVFQGVYSCNTSTSSWPTYYGPSKASQYWSVGGISSDQPVLELTPAQGALQGAMFWQAYYLGSNVTVTLIGTYTNGSSPVADGFVFYLFMEPTLWGVEPQYNYSIIYTFTSKVRYNPPLGGCVVLPQSSEPLPSGSVGPILAVFPILKQGNRPMERLDS